MNYPIRITNAASHDLEEILTWVEEHDSPAKANYVLGRLSEAIASIAALPRRGSRPRELPAGVNEDFRQVYFKPYRVIYEVTQSEIIIHVIADGRRNLQSLLIRRLTSD
jgi:toxin ParE1/3/4